MYHVVQEVIDEYESRICTSEDSHNLLKDFLLPKEPKLYVLSLGYINKLIRVDIMGMENLYRKNKDAIFGPALSSGATKVIIAHNKPIKSEKIPEGYIKTAKYLIKVGLLNGVKVLDFEIVSNDTIISFAEKNIVNFKSKKFINPDH